MRKNLRIYNACIYFIKNTKYCGKTKLFKLLYELDFKHFELTGSSVTGQIYKAFDYGPVPYILLNEIENKSELFKAYLSIIKQDNFNKFKTKRKFDESVFTKRQLKLLKEIAYIFRDATAQMMTKNSHVKNRPWDITLKKKGKYQEIDYFLALSNQSPDREFIEEDLADRKEIERVFGL